MRTLTRQQLYDLVWSKPVRDAAAELGISDVALKRKCRLADVPAPARGYWAKLAAGKKVIKPTLPPRAPGATDVAVGVSERQWLPRREPKDLLAEAEPVEPAFADALDEVEARIRKRIGKVPLVRGLDAPHPAIAKLLSKDQDRRAKQLASSFPDIYWDAPLFDSPFEQRRLKILNSVFLGVSRHGAKPWTHGKAARGLGVQVGVANVQLELDHPRAKKDRWGEEQVHGGKLDMLQLRIVSLAGKDGRRSEWVDAPGSTIEPFLTDIVIATILAGEINYRDGATARFRHALDERHRARAELEHQRLEAERKERERLQALERGRRARLLECALNVRQADDIRDLIKAVERVETGADAEAWCRWAAKVADDLDPRKNLANTLRFTQGS